jgi:hypothetical protein
MTVYDYPRYSYTDTTAYKRIITDVVSLIDPSDAPFINAIGGLDGGSGKFRFVNGKSTLIAWLEDSLITITTELATNSITSTILTFQVTDGSFFEVGDIIQIDDEQIWVSAVSTNTLTSTARGWFGTTSTTHASVAHVYLVGQARLEGADSTTKGFPAITTGSNWTQIFHREIKVTRTMNNVSQYGVQNELAYQADKVVPELMRLLERTVLHSVTGNIASSGVAGKMTGLPGFVTTNTATGASLTQAAIDSACMSIYKAGGGEQLIAPVAPEIMLKIKNFYDYYGTTAVPLFTVPRTETTLGMVINNIQTPFSKVALLLDRWCAKPTIAAASSVMPIVDPNNVGMVTLYPFTQEPLAKVGDSERVEVVGEFTLAVRQQKSHAFFSAVT